MLGRALPLFFFLLGYHFTIAFSSLYILDTDSQLKCTEDIFFLVVCVFFLDVALR